MHASSVNASGFRQAIVQFHALPPSTPGGPWDIRANPHGVQPRLEHYAHDGRGRVTPSGLLTHAPGRQVAPD